jgi:ubiquitin carboxyl-terminal hydrolase 4/11/15
VAVIELDDIPSNFPPPKKPRAKKSMFAFAYGNSDEEEDAPGNETPLADRLLVPIFHRLPSSGSSRYATHNVVAFASYLLITKEEAFDYDAILRKALIKVSTMTSTDLFEDGEDVEESSVSSTGDDEDDDDMVVTTSEDADSTPGAKIKSDGSGEDGYVDVSMNDASEASQGIASKPKSSKPSSSTSAASVAPLKSKRRSRVIKPGGFIPPQLRNLFQMKVFSQPGELIPTAWSAGLEDNRALESLDDRLHPPTTQISSKSRRQRTHMPGEFSDSEEDTAEETTTTLTNAFSNPDAASDSDSDALPDVNNIKAGPKAASSQAGHRPGSRASDKASSFTRFSPEPNSTPKEPLIRIGEALVLDWNPDAYDSLFSGSRSSGSMRGHATWESIPQMPDPELDRKIALRSSRKKKGVTLGDCLDEFNKEEILSENDAWYCPRCKEFRRASKKFELWKCPDILIIHLKRFSASRGLRDKIDVLVDFPIEGLDLSDRVAMKEEGKSAIYDLFAVDNHYGGLGGGHYTACAKNFVDGEWYDYNGTLLT